MKAVLIYSGGMDSTALLYQLVKDKNDVVCINFKYGAKHNLSERNAAKALCNRLNVDLIEIDLPFVGSLFNSNLLETGGEIPEGHYEASAMKQTIVPGRNTIMLSIALGYAESIDFDTVAIANHSGDHAIYPDCRPEWISSISLVAFHSSAGKVRVHAPFTDIDKGDVCKIGYDCGAPLAKTWTCYKGQEKHCGKCGACIERIEAFAKFNLVDDTAYQAP